MTAVAPLPFVEPVSSFESTCPQFDPLQVSVRSQEDWSEHRRECAAARAASNGALTVPHPRPWAHTMVRAAIEVLTGYRPITHLYRWVSAEVYEPLAQQAAVALRMRADERFPRPQVRRLRLSANGEGRVNVIGTIFDGARVRALAMEMVVRRGRWLVTDFQIG